MIQEDIHNIAMEALGKERHAFVDALLDEEDFDDIHVVPGLFDKLFEDKPLTFMDAAAILNDLGVAESTHNLLVQEAREAFKTACYNKLKATYNRLADEMASEDENQEAPEELAMRLVREAKPMVFSPTLPGSTEEGHLLDQWVALEEASDGHFGTFGQFHAPDGGYGYAWPAVHAFLSFDKKLAKRLPQLERYSVPMVRKYAENAHGLVTKRVSWHLRELANCPVLRGRRVAELLDSLAHSLEVQPRMAKAA
jgi:hypothetical protein